MKRKETVEGDLMARQAELFKRRLEFQRTEKNIKEFKKCYESLYKKGMISEETIKRVRENDYRAT
jgi:hypothetical protein